MESNFTTSDDDGVSALEYTEVPLPDDLCENIFARDFEPDWITTYKINPSVVQNFTSPKKLEELLVHKVLRTGDKLVLAEKWRHHDQSVIRVKTATIMSFGKDDKKQLRPDVRIELNGNYHSSIRSCHGPSFIVAEFNTINPGETSSAIQAWRDLEVFRNGKRMEALWYLRNSFHVWEEEKLAWQRRSTGHIILTPQEARKKWDRRG